MFPPEYPAGVRVTLARESGWTIEIEQPGRGSRFEHYSDWHRVERRVAVLGLTSRDRARRGVAAAMLAICVAAGPALAQDVPKALLPEPDIVADIVRVATRTAATEGAVPKDGFYVHTGQMITGAGWISIGPGYRWHFADGQAVVNLATALSWRGYKTAQAQIELPSLANDRLMFGSQVRWSDMTQISYFGAGPTSLEDGRSDYRMQTVDVVFYATARQTRVLSLNSGIGWLGRPGISSSTGPFDRGLPDTVDAFASEPGAALVRQPRYLRATLDVIADTRDAQRYPSRGGVYRAAWAGFRSREGGAFTFDRFELEGAHFVPLWTRRSVVALHGWALFTHTADGRAVPFYMLPSLGGHNTLRGYTDYRFHDRNLLGVNVESRWALFPHVDAAVFADAGNVAARAGDLDLGRRSYGTGVRLHTGTSTVARFDVGNSTEGWHLMFRLNDPLRLARITRRTATVPFVP
jgi:hypothetical protein